MVEVTHTCKCKCMCTYMCKSGVEMCTHPTCTHTFQHILLPVRLQLTFVCVQHLGWYRFSSRIHPFPVHCTLEYTQTLLQSPSDSKQTLTRFSWRISPSSARHGQQQPPSSTANLLRQIFRWHRRNTRRAQAGNESGARTRRCRPWTCRSRAL